MLQKYRRVLFILPIAVAFALPSSADADALFVSQASTASTIAEIFVFEDSVIVEFEVGLVDLAAFKNILPDALYEQFGFDPVPISDRVKTFLAEDIVVRTSGGARHRGLLRSLVPRFRIVRDQVTGEPLPVQPDSGEMVVFAKLLYSGTGKPKTLEFAFPGLVGVRASANIGFVAYHGGLPVNDFRYLIANERLFLDWSDPWYSEFEQRNLRRKYDAPISTYLYVEPNEVRKEIVLRPKDMENWMDLGLASSDVILAEDRERIKQRIAEFLSDKNPVTIDGTLAQGTLDRIHFIRRTLRTTGVVDPGLDIETNAATLGVIYVYPVPGLPQEISMTWELFAPRIQRIPATATDEAGGLPYFLTPDDPVLVWKNLLKNPTIPGLVKVDAPPSGRNWILLGIASLAALSLLGFLIRFGRGILRGVMPPKGILAGGAVSGLVLVLLAPNAVQSTSVTDEVAMEITGGLLQNIYRAFDYRDEESIYDTLEKSVAGDLLTEIYLEMRRSLELENQGGARVKVNEVEVVEAEARAIRGGIGFEGECVWNANGSVGHWGHIHQRTNQYRARLRIEVVEDVWKVTSLELLEEERL